MADCKSCIYNPVCVLWRKEEGQDANSVLTGGHFDCTLYKPQNEWISVDERLPEPEVEVVVHMRRKHANIEYSIITTAMYEDGTISTEDSDWSWYDLDFNYDEENDRYLIPEGWWEYRHYNPDDVYNNPIDDIVTHWMPLPEHPLKGGDE